MRTLLVRGMLAGLAAGVLATVFAYVAGEPSVDAAIGLEESAHAAHGHHHGEDALVDRGTQRSLGLFTGIAGYAVAMGGLFAIVFAVLHGRVTTTLRPRVSAVLLAASAFAVVVLVPFLKYPANPPAVGQDGTIGDRTALHFGFLALSLVAALLAAATSRTLADRFGAGPGALLGIGGYVAVMAVCGALLPAVDEVPPEFPGSLLWDFRVASLGTQVVLWGTLGLVFGPLADRVLRPAPAEVAAGQR